MEAKRHKIKRMVTRRILGLYTENQSRDSYKMKRGYSWLLPLRGGCRTGISPAGMTASKDRARQVTRQALAIARLRTKCMAHAQVVDCKCSRAPIPDLQTFRSVGCLSRMLHTRAVIQAKFGHVHGAQFIRQALPPKLDSRQQEGCQHRAPRSSGGEAGEGQLLPSSPPYCRTSFRPAAPARSWSSEVRQ